MNALYHDLQHYPFVIAGPCVIESEQMVMEVAEFLKNIQEQYPYVQIIFKSSFDKANRTSVESYRGPGMNEGLTILNKVRERTGLPILTDIHESYQAAIAADAVDILQIPAFLCRQTDLLLAASETGLIINIKKGQFLAGSDMEYPAKKVTSKGNEQIILTERGTSFGYHNLVVDFRNIADMKSLNYPVVFDATHAVQQPGGARGETGGQKGYIPGLSLAAKAFGVQGLFYEIHPQPDKALSDGANMLPLGHFEQLLASLFAD